MDKKLFVSYARKDYKLVEEFIEASRLGSFDLWMTQHSQTMAINGKILYIKQ